MIFIDSYWRHTEDELRKMSRPLTKEHKRRISVAKKGKHHSKEHNQNISKSLKGRSSPCGMLGKHHSDDTKWRISESNKGKVGSNTGKSFSEDHKRKISESEKGKIVSDETKQRQSISQKRRWQNLEHAQEQQRKMARGQNRHPNNPEMLLGRLLYAIFPNEWKYVGDGQFMLGGLCPDFVNVNGQKKIIEMFGRYWHQTRKNVKYHQTENGRRKIFAKFGFQTLVIWENELADLEAVFRKVEQFLAV